MRLFTTLLTVYEELQASINTNLDFHLPVYDLRNPHFQTPIAI